MSMPSMISRSETPIATVKVNGSYILAVYKGRLSEFDIILKYRQKDSNSISGWSRIRTPKHIHWAVDIIIKMHSDEVETTKFLDFLIEVWNEKTLPLKSEEDRLKIQNLDVLLQEVKEEANMYKSLSSKGEYSIKFLILIAKLLMIQEKTNLNEAYMFKQLLIALKNKEDIFKIVSIATHR